MRTIAFSIVKNLWHRESLNLEKISKITKSSLWPNTTMLNKTMLQSAICTRGKKEEEVKEMQYQFPCSIARRVFYTHSLEEIVHFKLFWEQS